MSNTDEFTINTPARNRAKKFTLLMTKQKLIMDLLSLLMNLIILMILSVF